MLWCEWRALIGAMPDNSPSPSLVLITSLACLQCGRTLGSFERMQGRAWPVTVQFRLAGSDSVCFANPRLIRCHVCHGTAIVEDESVERRRNPERVDWAIEPRRRGRPPSPERVELRERRAARRRLLNGDATRS